MTEQDDEHRVFVDELLAKAIRATGVATLDEFYNRIGPQPRTRLTHLRQRLLVRGDVATGRDQ